MSSFLIVDDASVLRRLLASELASTDLEIDALHEAASARVACELVERDPAIDVALVDVGLCGDERAGLVRDLRKIRPPERLSIVVVGAPSDDTAMRRAIGAGADRCLARPCGAAEIETALRGLVRETSTKA